MKKMKRLMAMCLVACMLMGNSTVAISDTEMLPTAEPTAQVTASPTEVPAAEPAVQPTEKPTAAPTEEPEETPAESESLEQITTPTAEPTAMPTAEPTATHTAEPTATHTAEPTATHTAEPTATHTAEPTATSTAEPTATPTIEPTATPTVEPTAMPTAEPTATPTAEPMATPTVEPTATPTAEPMATPTAEPTETIEPTAEPTVEPTPTMPVVNDIPLLSENVLAVQAMIDALPAADDLGEMNSDEIYAVYEDTQAAYEAYLELTEEEQAMISTGKLEALFSVFNSAVAPMAETSGDGWKIENGTLYITGKLTSLPDETYSIIEIESGGELALSGSTSKNIVNRGTISSGNFTATTYTTSNYGTISGGSFNHQVDNKSGGTITNGTFNAKVANYGTITKARFGSSASLSGNKPQSVIHSVDGSNTALSYNAALPDALPAPESGKVWCGSDGLPVSGNVPLNYTSYTQKTQYTITVGAVSGGTVSADKEKAVQGEKVTLTITTGTGYVLESLTVNDENVVAQVADGKYIFDMPENDVAVTVVFKAIDYTITMTTSGRGEITAPQTAHYNEQVTLNITPAEGYELESLTVDGTDVADQVTEGEYTFTMSAANVAVKASFKAIVYSITIDSTIENGTVEADKYTAVIGNQITLRITPATGYALTSLTVNSEDYTEQVTDGSYSFEMPAGDVTVNAEFSAVDYSITVNADENGTVTTNNETANYNNEIILTVTPNEGYELASLMVKGTDVTAEVANGQYTFTMPAENIVVTATFQAIDYSITIHEPVGNGTVVASKSTANIGEPITLSITSATGYALTSLTVNGKDVTADVADGQYTFNMPAENIVVTATFQAIDYDITVNDTKNGTVSANKETANYGDEVILTIAPSEGYVLESLMVNETDVIENVAEGKYVFNMLAVDVNITASFKAIDYTININGPFANGTVEANKATANIGEPITLTITPATGYVLESLMVKDETGVEITVTNSQFTMPASNVIVSAVFIGNNYSITVNADANGVVVAQATANYEDQIALTITPKEGYELESLTVKDENGAEIDVKDNQFTMPAGNVTVTATFKAINYTITIDESIENGTIATENSTAIIGGTVALIITPDIGYDLTSVTVEDENGAEIDVTDNQFTMPAGNVTVTATFGLVEYTITVNEAENGTVTKSRANAYYNDEITLTLTPNEGYELEKLMVNDADVTAEVVDGQYIFSMPAEDVTVTASFLGIRYSIIVNEDIGNGVITADPPMARNGDTVTLTITPNPGYVISYLYVDNIDVTGLITDNQYTFTMPDMEVYVGAWFEMQPYTITVTRNGEALNMWDGIDNGETLIASSDADGATFKWYRVCHTDAGMQEIFLEDGYSYTVTSDVFNNSDILRVYMYLGDVNLGCMDFEYLSDGEYPILHITTDCTVESPETAMSGSTVKFKLIAQDGYRMQRLDIFGPSGLIESAGPDGDGYYSFTMPKGLVTIVAVFVSGDYDIVVDYGSLTNGSLDVAKKAADEGESVAIWADPSYGYEVDTITITGDESGNTQTAVLGEDGVRYWFTMPAENVTISAAFKITETAELSVSIISVTRNKALQNGETVSVGEELSWQISNCVSPWNWAVDKVRIYESERHHVTVPEGSKIGLYVFENADDYEAGLYDQAICSVVFPIGDPSASYTVSIADSENGTVTADKYTAAEGETVILTVTPDEGYELDTLTVDGADATAHVADGQYIFTMPAGDVTVSATFVRAYTVTIADGIVGGTVSASKSEYAAGDRVALRITPDTGYGLSSLTVDAEPVDFYEGMQYYEFTMPDHDVTITATFETSTYEVWYAMVGGLSKYGSVSGTENAKMGNVVNLTVSPAEGCRLKKLEVYNYDTEKSFSVTANENGDYSFTMPAAHVQVQYAFELIPYTVTIAETEHGTVAFANGFTSPFEPENVVRLDIQPNEGYVLDSVTIKGDSEKTYEFYLGTYDFLMPYENVTVYVTFKEESTVTIAETEHGTVYSDSIVNLGSEFYLNIQPDAGYGLYSVTVKGDSGTEYDFDYYANCFLMPYESVTVYATFASAALTVTRGDETLADAAQVFSGNVLTASCDAAASFLWKCNGETVGTDAIYTVPDSIECDDLLIVHAYDRAGLLLSERAFLCWKVYTVTIAETEHGTVTAEPDTAAEGDPINLFITPEEGYVLSGLTVDGQSIDVNEDTSYYGFAMPAHNVTVNATFEPKTYLIAYMQHGSPLVWGTVTGPDSAKAGEKVVLTVSPADGYQITMLSFDTANEEFDVTTDANGEYSFTMPASHIDVRFTFAQTYAISIDEGITGGKVTSNKATATQDETVTLTVTPYDGYHLAGLSVVDAFGNSCQTFSVVDQDTDEFVGYGFAMPASSVTVSAVFSRDEDEGYAVIVTPATGGTVNVNKTTAAEGETIIFTAEPDADCELETISVTNVAGNEITVMENTNPDTGESDYRFAMPAGNATITVVFARRYAIAYGNGVTGPATAKAGETVTLTVTPDEGYVLDTITVTPTVELTGNADGTWSFQMPASNVSVNAAFVSAEPSYIITIPASLNLNDNQILTIKVDDVENLNGKQIVVDVDSDGTLESGEHSIEYDLSHASFAFEGEGSFDLVLTVGNTTGKPAGTYEDTLTFTATVQARSEEE